MYKYASIIINNKYNKLDKMFTYSIPKELSEKIQVGHRVKVPFGIRNKSIDGFVIELFKDANLKFKVKNIIKLCDDKPILTLNNIKLIQNMRQMYLCTYLEAIKVMIAPGIIEGNKEKIENFIFTGKPLEGKYNKSNYMKIYDYVFQNPGVYNKNKLSKEMGFSLSSINTLIKYGFLVSKNTKVTRYDDKTYEDYSEKNLNGNQSLALYNIINTKHKVTLIHGVTGSGKTEIYMHLVKDMIKKNKDSIILVPEISLTPQMVERFKGRFGKNVAIFHSRLSDGERFDEWTRVKNGEVKVAIGARSAVFLPFNNLGIIIIDEEHETSYKSDNGVKYRAADIANLRSIYDGCKVVLGSATPSLETYYKAKNGLINLITIDKRIDGASMPKVSVIDMREELIKGNRSIFSEELYQSIQDKLQKKEQIILFLNRRGFSTFVSCRKCGYVFKCNHCDISLTYHSMDKFLKCHYCGKMMPVPNLCPKCKSKYVKYFGVGTEKIEQEVKRCFPQAKVLRMDLDTTRGKNSYESIYKTFKNKDADILVGTQMIAKGLDFSNVTLVGVVAADISLNLPDYRSTERTFQLLTQVSGRAGRGEKEGKVVIQTYNPQNYSIINAAKGDYKTFYEEEIQIRKSMNYPPFSEVLLINLSSKNEELLIKSTQNLGIILKKELLKYDNLDVLGPSPSPLSKIKEMYRWQIIIKGQIDKDLLKKIKETVYTLVEPVYNNIRVGLDINPNSLL